MLKVEGVVSSKSPEIVINEHEPIRIIWDNDSRIDGNVLKTHWKIIGVFNSLLWFGICPETGRLQEVIINSENHYNETNYAELLDWDIMHYPSIESLDGLDRVEGIPVFDIIPLMLDHVLFKMYYTEDTIKIVLSDGGAISRTIVSDKVVFGVDDTSNICVIYITATKEEIDILKKNPRFPCSS